MDQLEWEKPQPLASIEVRLEDDDKGTCKLQKDYSPEKLFIWAMT